MNDFFLSLGSSTAWTNYLKFMKPFSCCRNGGPGEKELGVGLRPFAINEMSMLAYYHHLYPNEFKLLPVVPVHDYILNRFVCNMSRFAPGGPEVGPPTGLGIWDPNSWGQFIGGTSNRKGRDVGFTDSSHISGQAIRMSKCKVLMECSNISYPIRHAHSNESNNTALSKAIHSCYTLPYVQCGVESIGDGLGPKVPLWNLHVHSKHTHLFHSKVCPCHVVESKNTN